MKFVAYVVAALAALGVSLVQPGLAKNIHKVKQDDVLVLPPPAELRAMTLGYRSATADVLWAQLLYQYGLHWAEHRPFPDLVRYLDAILELEPDYVNVYLFADTLLLYRVEVGTEDDARTSRTILERGIKERPYDPEVWMHYGQFVAFTAASFLKDEHEIDEWRRVGALAIAHAVELGADPDRSLAASTILRKSGERDAALKTVERAYAMTDDPELRRQLLFKFKQLEGGDEAELAITSVDRETRARFGLLSRGEALLVGPGRGAAACAGPESFGRKRCPRDWTQFIEEQR